jgi:hypothetical protein
MDAIEILQQDYLKFPQDQTYSIYAPDVYFQDPVFRFRGVELYKLMIKFIKTFFWGVKIELHAIERSEAEIKTRWTLSWTALLPWKPPISVSGWSSLKLNPENLIISHIDYWDCSRLDVIKQHLFFPKNG